MDIERLKKAFYISVLPLIFLFLTPPTLAVTLVYNLKVRRVFNIEPVLERMKKRLPISVVPIFFTRSRHIVETRTALDTCEKRRAGGALFNLRYIPTKNWWLELTTGLETDHGTFEGTDTFHASRTGFDDIVFSAGYRHFIGKKLQVVAYGLAGLPTRRKITLEDRHGPLVGTRLFNLGLGGEASYSFLSSLARSFSAILQTRFIHGFNRSWDPILPKGSDIQPGNATDILFTFQFREKRTIVETGYNVTFFTNQAIILPTEKIEASTAIRHSWYATATHAIFQGPFGKPFLFGAGLNMSRSKTFDTKNLTAWIHGTIVF